MWIKEVHICIVQSFLVTRKMCGPWEQVGRAVCGMQCVKNCSRNTTVGAHTSLRLAETKGARGRSFHSTRIESKAPTFTYLIEREISQKHGSSRTYVCCRSKPNQNKSFIDKARTFILFLRLQTTLFKTKEQEKSIFWKFRLMTRRNFTLELHLVATSLLLDNLDWREQFQTKTISALQRDYFIKYYRLTFLLKDESPDK